MIGLAESFLTWLASTLLPAFVGLCVITWASKKVSVRYIVAFGFGILFWFFVDTISGSAVLDVNSGFRGGLAQVGLVLLFLIGVGFFFWVDRKRDILSPQSAVGKYGLTIPLLVAIALGIHGLGEGAAFGATVYSTSSTSLLDAFGGLTAGVAYILHKVLEPMMIGACYSVYSKPEGGTVGSWLRSVFVMSIVFVIPSLLGAATGYLVAYDTTYFFALGTGAAIYVVFRLAGPLFVLREAATSRETIKVAVSWTLGIMALYASALFHS
jgi:zinc transporter ZupT